MNDPRSLAGLPSSLEVDGETYRLRPLDFEDIGELQCWVDSRRLNPFDVVREEIATGAYSVAQQKYLFEVAVKLKGQPGPQVGDPEASAMIGTADGFKEVLYLAVRRDRPGFTREMAHDLFLKIGAERFRSEVVKATNADMVIGRPKAETPSGPATTEGTQTPGSTGGDSTTG